jgi:metal-responsive CopG/Arc/MetJ family transcriptional regulator
VEVVNIVVMHKCKSTGISFPADIMNKIDTERGDVSRSRFLLRLIEQAYGEKEKEGGLDLSE